MQIAYRHNTCILIASLSKKIPFVTELAEHIIVRDQDPDCSAEFGRFFPDFIWALRDFTLDLQLDGKSITPDDYMEDMLLLKKGKHVKDGISSCIGT